MPSPTSTACCKLLGKATGVARTCCKLLEKVQSVASRACCKLLEKLASRGCCKLLEQVKSVAPSDCMVSKCKRNDRYQPPPTPHPLLPRSIQRGSSLLRQQCWSWPKIWQQSRTFESPRYQKLATKWDDPPYSTRFFFRCWFYELLHLCKYLGQPCDPAPQNIRRIIILPLALPLAHHLSGHRRQYLHSVGAALMSQSASSILPAQFSKPPVSRPSSWETHSKHWLSTLNY